MYIIAGENICIFYIKILLNAMFSDAHTILYKFIRIHENDVINMEC